MKPKYHFLWPDVACVLLLAVIIANAVIVLCSK